MSFIQLSNQLPQSVVLSDGSPALFRNYGGPSDLQGMLTVRQGSRYHDQVDPLSARDSVPTIEQFRQAYREVKPGDPDKLIVEINGAIVGYNILSWWNEAGGLRVYLHLGWLLPGARNQGLGTRMVRWAQARIEELALQQGISNQRILATNVSSTEHEARTLIENEGYQIVHSLSDMALKNFSKLPQIKANLPTGVEQRLVKPEHYRAIYEALKDARLGLFGEDGISEEDYQNFLEYKVKQPNFDPSLWQIAWAGSEVVGLVLNYISSNGTAEVNEVAVRQAWKRQGIAQALMVEGLYQLQRQGLRDVRLYTAADNRQGAKNLYQKLGFNELKIHYLYRKPF